jgi:hypothetical protein
VSITVGDWRLVRRQEARGWRLEARDWGLEVEANFLAPSSSLKASGF